MVEKLLKNCCVLVTRPAYQSENLASLIHSHGGTPILLPTIAIKPETNIFFDATQVYDMAIFTSQNAVIHGHAILQKYGQENKLPKIIAIGDATKKCLQTYGFVVDITSPPPFNSENLLQLPILKNCHGKKIIIFSGKNSRDILFKTLTEQQAIVYLVEVYERKMPLVLPEFQDIFNKQKIDVIVTTSNEALKNLVAMFSDQRQTIENTSHVVVSERGYQLAKALHIKDIFKTRNVSDEAIIKTIGIICQKKKKLT